jgi:hypothetical protein
MAAEKLSLSSTLPNKTRKILAVIGSLSLLTTLSACANGKNAPTAMIRQVTDGVEADSGAIKVRDFLLVVQPDGSAAIVGTFLNSGTAPDTLVSISVGGIPAVIKRTMGNDFTLQPDQPIIFAGDSANASGVIPGLKATSGSRIDATVTFANAAPVTKSVLVREKDGVYANVG